MMSQQATIRAPGSVRTALETGQPTDAGMGLEDEPLGEEELEEEQEEEEEDQEARMGLEEPASRAGTPPHPSPPLTPPPPAPPVTTLPGPLSVSWQMHPAALLPRASRTAAG